MGITGPFGWSGPPRENNVEWHHEASVLYATQEEATVRWKEYVIAKYGALRGRIDEEYEATYCYWKEGWGPLSVDEYSESITDAWLVVEKMGMVTLKNGGPNGSWSVGFVMHDKEGEPHWIHAEAATVPLAICLAALKACGVEIRDGQGEPSPSPSD